MFWEYQEVKAQAKRRTYEIPSTNGFTETITMRCI